MPTTVLSSSQTFSFGPDEKLRSTVLHSHFTRNGLGKKIFFF